MAQEAPQPQDVLDFQFKLQCRLKVFNNESSAEFAKQCNLVATASRFGLVFVGTASKQFQVIRIEDIEELVKDVTEYPCRVIEIPSKPKHLSVNCDGTKLCVVVERDECATAIFYDVLSFLKEQVTVIKEIRLSATPRVDVIQTEWNPALPNIFTACKSDGLLGVYEFKDVSLDIKELPAGAAATCFCWSPKGKQLAVGSKDGKITQYKPDLKAVKVINEPPLEGKPRIISLMWASSFQFIGVYRESRPDARSALVVIDAPKTGNTVYTNYEDICYSYGDARPPQFYMFLEQHWNVLMVASSNSMEVGVLGNESEKWLQWNLADSCRAELPLSASKQDTFPIGLTLNTSTTRNATTREKTQSPESPMLLLLSHQGQLCCFYTVNLKKGITSACSPMEKVAYAQNLFKKVDGKQEPIVSLPSAPKPLLPTPTIQQTPIIAQAQQTPVMIQPQQTPAMIQPQQTPVMIPPQQMPVMIQPQQTPVMKQPQQTPVMMQSQQPATTIQSQLMFGAPTAKPISPNLFFPAPPASQLSQPQPTGNLFGGHTKAVQPPKTFTQPQLAVKMPALPPETAEPVKTPTKRGQDGKSIPNKETESMIAELIREECLALDAEVKALMHSCREIDVNVGSDSEATQMVQQCNALQEFVQALKETSAGQTAEIHTLKQTVIQSWAWYEEAHSRFHSSQDPVLMKVMQGRPLDPASQQQLEDISYLSYYLDSQLLQANKSLDDQWEAFQDSLSKNKKVEMPTMEAIYQSMIRQNATLQKQRYVLKDISNRIQSHRRHQNHNTNILISLEKVEDLQEELDNLKLYPEESKPQIHYKKILERQKKLTKEKCDKLFKFFSKREVTRVSVAKPQLNNTTVQLSTLLAAPLSPIAVDKKMQAVKKVDFVMSTPKPQHGKNLTVIFDKNKGIIPTSMPMVNLNEAKTISNLVINPVKNASLPAFIGVGSTNNKNTAFVVKQDPIPTPTTVVSKSTFSFTSLSTSSIDSNKMGDGNKIGVGFGSQTGLTIKPIVKSSAPEVSMISNANQMYASQPQLSVTAKTNLQKSASTASPFNLNSSNTAFNVSSSHTTSATGATTSPFNIKIVSSTVGTTGFSLNAVSTSVLTTSASVATTTSTMLFGTTATTTTSKTFIGSSTTLATPASMFGGTLSNMFGAATTTATSNIISSSSATTSASNIFTASSTTKPSLFSSTTPGVFGVASATTSTGTFGISQPATTAITTGIFGKAQPSSTTAVAPTTPTGFFGTSSPSTTTATGTFGTIATTNVSASSGTTTPSTVVTIASTSTGTTGIFSGTKQVTATTTAGIFDGSKSIFGGVPTAVSSPSVGSAGTSESSSTASVSTFGTTGSTGIFGSTAPSSTSIFGGTATSKTTAAAPTASNTSVFGSTPTTSAPPLATTATSIFGGQAASSIFASPATTSATSEFGKPTASVFGSTTATTTQAVFAGFGTATTKTSVFGAAATTTSSVFGSTGTTTSSVFGSTAVTTTSVFSSTTTTASVFGTPATTASVFGTPATTTASVFGTPATTASVFGTPVTTTASVFGTPATTTSVFGTPATTASVFGTPATTPAFGSTGTTSPSVFGAPATTTTGVFGAATTTSTFSGPFTTQTTTAFGGGEATSPFGAKVGPFGSTAAGPVFGQTAPPFGSSSGSGSIFGGNTANTPTSNVFGSGTTTNTFGSNTSVFGSGTPSTAASPFRGGSTFGTSTNTNSPFGTTASTATSPFAQAASTFGSAPTFGSGFGTSNSFGFNNLNVGNTAPTTTTASGFGTFGQSAQNPFGRTNTPSTGSVFGTPATTASSIFGAPATTASSSSVFGAVSPFNKPAAPAFGSPPTFGQSPGFGQSAFGQASTFGSPGFGSGGGAFSSGGQTIQQGGFGSPAFQKPASGFGSAPVFGSTSPSFGSPPSFGGAPTFGGGGTFGSPQKVFGSPTAESSFGSVAQSSTFGNLANQNTLGFGNLAQQAASPPAPQSSSFSGGSSFSSWR